MNFSKYFLLGVPSWDKKYHLTNFCPQEQEPVIEGQLKEKKGGRWSIFKKWKSRYFTLSGDKLTYKDTVMIFYPNEEIPSSYDYGNFLHKIRNSGNDCL